jgi:tRNA pseudouridine55 synthase
LIGFLNLLKPPGMTSHDAVQVVRRLLGEKQVGHTGTLDPAAAGVLVLSVGQATRLSEFLLTGTKAYWAEVLLGVQTDSGDAEGKVLRREACPQATEARARQVLDGLTGTLTMRPPAYSAVRIDGKKAYKRARAGEVVEVPEREVTIETLTLRQWLPGKFPRLRLEVECSHGTYLRSLAEMIGERLGTGGMLAALLRTRVGVLTIEHSVTLAELADNPHGRLVDPVAALPHLERLTVDARGARALAHGNPVPVAHDPSQALLVLTEAGELLCLGKVEAGQLHPSKVFADV